MCRSALHRFSVAWGLVLATVFVVVWTSGECQRSYFIDALPAGAYSRMLAAGCGIVTAGGNNIPYTLRCPLWVMP
jgi:hypothetical protein